MKRTYLILAVSVIMAGAMFTRCQSSGKKVEDAENKLQEAKNDVHTAKQDLNQAIRDSVSEYEKFKMASDEKIAAHDKSILELKARIADEKKGNKAEYQKKLARLEQKNSNMKKRLVYYKEEEKTKWEKFKISYNRDMDELNQEFRDLAVRKVK